MRAHPEKSVAHVWLMSAARTYRIGAADCLRDLLHLGAGLVLPTADLAHGASLPNQHARSQLGVDAEFRQVRTVRTVPPQAPSCHY